MISPAKRQTSPSPSSIDSNQFQTPIKCELLDTTICVKPIQSLTCSPVIERKLSSSNESDIISEDSYTVEVFEGSNKI